MARDAVARSASMKWAWPLAALLQIGTAAARQDPPANPPAAASPDQAVPPGQSAVDANPAGTGCCLAVNGAMVDIEIGEPISSKRHKRGDKFALRLAEPLVVDGQTVLPAGTPGVGEIIHAAASGGGGKAGELLLAARYLEVDGRQIPLRGFRMGGAGKDNTTGALAASMAVGPFAQFIHGREIEIPSGARASAKLAADTALIPIDTPSTPTGNNP
ncbi:MAG TPA: hypothetical protein PLI83_01840 [Thermomonas sp.]|nr:hypothetical protein [Thermomonas sp.]